jgi:hypothetical protein
MPATSKVSALDDFLGTPFKVLRAMNGRSGQNDCLKRGSRLASWQTLKQPRSCIGVQPATGGYSGFFC